MTVRYQPVIDPSRAILFQILAIRTKSLFPDPKFPGGDEVQLVDQASIFQLSGVPGTGNVSMRAAARH